MFPFDLILMNQTHYKDALLFQEGLFQAQLNKKAAGNKTSNSLIVLEHHPVYTLGKSGKVENLIVPIEKTGANFFQTTRGGDITYHGPGQLTIYPIFDLESFDIGVKAYVDLLEKTIIQYLGKKGILGQQSKEESGVWIDLNSNDPRKICAIGIKVSRGITMHGLAFNVNTDLSYFENIIPCGIEDKTVTSLAKELGHDLDLNLVIEELTLVFQEVFSSL